MLTFCLLIFIRGDISKKMIQPAKSTINSPLKGSNPGFIMFSSVEFDPTLQKT